MNTDDVLKGRLKDLANKAYNKNIYTYTNFLSSSDLEVFYSIAASLKYIDYQMYGGREGCDRLIICFGSREFTGYECDYPITTLHIAPLLDKFSEELSHRDILGALMNLGIEREMIGDILLKEASHTGKKSNAYIFCVSSIADFIIENLTRIKHTSVKVSVCPEEMLPDISLKKEEITFIVASPRIDAVIAAITKLSRNNVVTLFREKKISLNNRICENNSYMMKAEDILSIRGYGKYAYKGTGSETRKGRIYVILDKYI
jgi:RNA-binding protein YlmH